MARVSLENVTKKTGALCPVFGFTLEVKDKEFTTLLGPSGSGKTTVLRLVAGLERLDSGHIYIDDSVADDLTPADRDVAMVFQTYALYPHLSVYRNLASPLEARKMPKTEIDRDVKEVADILRISHLLNKMPIHLSGGEMQRVAIGRAIIRRPKVFLFDEPLTNLDAKLRVHMRAELKRLQRDIGQTTLYATHDEVEAMTMSDRIAVMRRGKIEQYDSPSVIYNNPQNYFVASFIGTPPMNFIDCSYLERDGKAYLDAASFSIDVSDLSQTLKERGSDSEMILGIRPSDVSVNREPVTHSSIETEVYVLEPMGSMAILDLNVAGKIFKVRVPKHFKARTGERVWITFTRERMHVFDKKTGRTII